MTILGIDVNNLNTGERIIVNSLIVGGIVFFSTVSTDNLPTLQNLWTAFVGATLAGLTQLATLTKEDHDDKNVPKEYRKKPPMGLLMFI